MFLEDTKRVFSSGFVQLVTIDLSEKDKDFPICLCNDIHKILRVLTQKRQDALGSEICYIFRGMKRLTKHLKPLGITNFRQLIRPDFLK